MSDKVIRNIPADTLSSVYIKKGTATIIEGRKKKSFRFNSKLSKGKFVQISVFLPLGMEYIRIFMDENHLHFINFQEKSYYSENFNKTDHPNIHFQFFQNIFLKGFSLIEDDDTSVLENVSSNTTIRYGEFIRQSDICYPQKIEINFNDNKYIDQIRLDLSVPDFSPEITPSFKIPSNYRKSNDLPISNL